MPYQVFLRKLFTRLNSGRREHFLEEQCRLSVAVGRGSTVRVNNSVRGDVTAWRLICLLSYVSYVSYDSYDSYDSYVFLHRKHR